MRKIFAIIFYVLAGFFVYMVCLLSFVNQPMIPKWIMTAGFTVPALLFLCFGLGINDFHSWKRDSGVVLLSGAGFTCFLIFTFMCLYMTEDFRQMMKPDSLSFFNTYASGSVFTLSVGILGILLLKKGTREAEQVDGHQQI